MVGMYVGPFVMHSRPWIESHTATYIMRTWLALTDLNIGGNHVPQVLDNVAENERCSCTPKVEKEGKQYPPKGPQPDM